MTSERFISIHFVSNKIKIRRFILSVIRYIKLVLLPPGAKSGKQQGVGSVCQTLREISDFPGFEDQASEVFSECLSHRTLKSLLIFCSQCEYHPYNVSTFHVFQNALEMQQFIENISSLNFLHKLPKLKRGRISNLEEKQI